jgi:Polyketide cyclase / dehydrase and lipid transport
MAREGDGMAQVERSKRFGTSAEDMWRRIGDFQGIDAWHPAIAGCASQEGGEVRELALPDGNKVVERLVVQTDNSYTYRILDAGPLPVSDYEATITVRDGEGGGSAIGLAGDVHAGRGVRGRRGRGHRWHLRGRARRPVTRRRRRAEDLAGS